MDAPQPVGSIRGAIESSVFDWLKCSNILMGGHQEMMTRAGVGMNEADLSFVRSWAAISMDEIVRPGQTLEQFHHMSYQACASSWPLDGLGARGAARRPRRCRRRSRSPRNCAFNCALIEPKIKPTVGGAKFIHIINFNIYTGAIRLLSK